MGEGPEGLGTERLAMSGTRLPCPQLPDAAMPFHPKRKVKKGYGFMKESWPYIFALLNWWSLLLMALTAAIPLGTMFFVATPYRRDIDYTDPAIAFEDFGDTISPLMSVLIPCFIWGCGMLWIEYFLFRHAHTCASNSMATIAHFCKGGVEMYLSVIFLTQMTNFLTGMYRPDYLDRCELDPSGTECTNTDTHWLDDGRKSFPSGHASGATAICMYYTTYLLWALFGREGSVLSKYCASKGRSFQQTERMYAFTYLAVFVPFVSAWLISISRVVDNKHNTADTVGGVLLGLTMSVLGALKDIGVYVERVRPRFIFPEGGGGAGGAVSGSPGGAGVLSPLSPGARARPAAAESAFVHESTL